MHLLGLDVHEDVAGYLDEGDDEGPQGDGADVVQDQMADGLANWVPQVGLVPGDNRQETVDTRW